MGVADSGQRKESTERKFLEGYDAEVKGEAEVVQRVREIERAHTNHHTQLANHLDAVIGCSIRHFRTHLTAT
jgi:uncharacterized protein YdbL (DUF1318 family)